MRIYSCYVSGKAATAWERLTSDQQCELAMRAANLQDVEVLIPRDCKIRVVLAEDLATTTDLLGKAVSSLLHKQSDELRIAAKWAKERAQGRAYRLEVPCVAGRIDIMLDYAQELIEAKYARAWKSAIGQAICYRHCFPRYSASLLLINKLPHETTQLLEAVCKSQDIRVYWI